MYKTILFFLLPAIVLTAETQFNFKSKSCEVLEDQAKAIISWSQKLGSQFEAEIPNCSCDTEYCIMDFYSVSPELVKIYNQKYSEISGPNCWNRALVFANILPTLSYSTPQEMSLWMNSPLCTLREEDETPRPGDIVAIRSYYGSEVHGFTYLTDKTSFSKNGFHKSSPYSYQSTESVFKIYGVSKECWNVPNMPAPGSTCHRARGAFYNCQSLDEYSTSANFEPSELVSNSLLDLARIGKTVELQLFDFIITDASYYEKLYKDVYSIKWLAVDMLTINGLHPTENFLWKAARERSNSLLDQIIMIQDQS